MSRLSFAIALSFCAVASRAPLVRAEEAASVSIRATRGEFELRDIVDVSALKLGSTRTLTTTKYRTICSTPCQVTIPPGPVDLWAVDLTGTSRDAKKKLWLGPGTHEITIKAGRSGVYAGGMLGLTVGAVTAFVAGYRYLNPGKTEDLGANGQLVETQKSGSTAALVTAIVGLVVCAAGSTMLIVGDTSISGGDSPTDNTAAN